MFKWLYGLWAESTRNIPAYWNHSICAMLNGSIKKQFSRAHGESQSRCSCSRRQYLSRERKKRWRSEEDKYERKIRNMVHIAWASGGRRRERARRDFQLHNERHDASRMWNFAEMPPKRRRWERWEHNPCNVGMSLSLYPLSSSSLVSLSLPSSPSPPVKQMLFEKGCERSFSQNYISGDNVCVRIPFSYK